MKIIFYNVEHGSCTHIITPNNKHILVDVGSKTEKSISYYIKNIYFKYSNDGIDDLIITHPHEDHIYDLPNLYTLLKPRILHRPKEAFNIDPTLQTPIHLAIANCANSMNAIYNGPIEIFADPLRPENNGGVDIEIIPTIPSMASIDDLNTFSFIVIVKYGYYKFIITGDNPKSILSRMVAENFYDIKNKISNATVLLAPHHGRTTEYCNEFFKLVNPILTVVSDKSIVHNTQDETSTLYKGRGAELNGIIRYVLTTRNDGTISFNLNSNSCIVNMSQEVY